MKITMPFPSLTGGDTVDSNISAMITVSDNDAANTLVNWLGNGDEQCRYGRR